MNQIVSSMVLSAGYGTRLRPITNKIPKPLVSVGGVTLLDRALDSLKKFKVKTAVVNVHYLAEQIVTHLKDRKEPAIIISDETEQLLDSAGGIIKALLDLGSSPFLVLNADTFWIDPPLKGTAQVQEEIKGNLERMSLAWNEKSMDMLLMMVEPGKAVGHSGGVDFFMDQAGRLIRARDHNGSGSFIYGGVAIIHPRIFVQAHPGVQSLNLYFDKAIASGRLYGLPMKGLWITVSVPQSIAEAEAALKEYAV